MILNPRSRFSPKGAVVPPPTTAGAGVKPSMMHGASPQIWQTRNKQMRQKNTKKRKKRLGTAQQLIFSYTKAAEVLNKPRSARVLARRLLFHFTSTILT